jgi:hypothetical protein
MTINIRECLIKTGGFTEEEIKAAELTYEVELNRTKSVERARKATRDGLREDAARLELLGARNLEHQSQLLRWAEQTTDSFGNKREGRILTDLLSNRRGNQPYGDVDALHDAIWRIEIAPMGRFIHDFRPGVLTSGLRRRYKSKQAMNEAIRAAAYGDMTDVPPALAAYAREQYQKIMEVRESIIGQLQAHGSNIKLLRGRRYGLPQVLRTDAVKNMEMRTKTLPDGTVQEGYVEFMMRNLDRDNMIDPRTGHPYDDRSLIEMLEFNYKDIDTDGVHSGRGLNPGQAGSRAASDIYGDHRFFFYKDKKAHKEVAERLGNPDIYETTMEGINDLTRTLAVMQMLGPSGKRNLDWLQGHLLAKAKRGELTIETPDELLKDLHRQADDIANTMKPGAPAVMTRYKAQMAKVVEARGTKRAGKRNPNAMTPRAVALRKEEAKLQKLEQELADLLPDDPGEKVIAMNMLQALKDDFIHAQFERNSWIKQVGRRKSKRPPKQVQIDYIESQIKKSNAYYDEATGVGFPPSTSTTIMQIARNASVFGMLGNAVASAITDPAHALMRRTINAPGLDKATTPIRMLEQIGRHFAEEILTLGKTSRIRAIELGLGSDRALETLSVGARYGADIDAKGVSGHLASGTLSSTGLLKWTEIQKRIAAEEIMGSAHRYKGKSFNSLPSAFKDILKRHNITPDDWDVIRASEAHLRGGFSYSGQLTPVGVSRTNKKVGQKWGLLIRREQLFQTPEVNAEYRGQIRQYFPDRAGLREVMKTAILFKSFPIVTLQNMVMQVGQNLIRKGVAPASVDLAMGLTAAFLFGNLSLWARDIASGIEPDFEGDLDPANVGRMLRVLGHATGLGLPIDLLTLGENRRGGRIQGAYDFIAGPFFGTMGGGISHALQGDPIKAYRKFRKFLPHNSSWHTRHMWDYLHNSAMYWMDPKGYKKMVKGRKSFLEKQNKEFMPTFDPKKWHSK